MIFYLRTDCQLAPTQALAGKDFVQIDIPTDKPRLMNFINELLAKLPKESENPEPAANPEPIPTPAPTPAYGDEKCPRCWLVLSSDFARNFAYQTAVRDLSKIETIGELDRLKAFIDERINFMKVSENVE